MAEITGNDSRSGKKNQIPEKRSRTPLLRNLLLVLLAGGLIAMCFSLYGCQALEVMGVQTGLIANPYYREGEPYDDGGIEEYYFIQLPSYLNQIYRELYTRIRDGEDSATLLSSVTTEDFWTAYYAVLADHPEFFWVGSNIEIQQSSLSGKVISYSQSVTVPPDRRESMRQQLEAAADECLLRIEADASEYEIVKSVYEYIIDTTDYAVNSRENQNIQSALLYHSSVCAGYARAFQYILHRRGMFCTYVTGTIDSGGDHGWNIVRINDRYYNVDVTWGDPVFLGEASPGMSVKNMNYNYLCCTDAELAVTHTPTVDIELPVCDDESLNYYRLYGMYYDDFDYDQIYNALMQSVWNGEDSVIMKFGSRAAFDEAYYELFQNGLLQDAAQYLMEVNGTASWNYGYRTDEEFYLITIFW